ncbi:MAG: NAD-binding protein [Caldilineales bacterium]|nr:NAD-binding protein [Caldilineales bacterium]
MQEIAEILGLRPHDLRRLIVALVLILAILAFGVIGYSILAHLSVADALYMTMITISTVGFTEIGNFDSSTRLFSTLLIIVTIVWGAWALQSVLGTFMSPQFRMGVSQMRSVRKAKRMEDHTIICGFGRIGRSVAAELERNGEAFLILEQNEELVEGLRERGWHIVQGDATDDKALLSAGVTKAKRLLAVLNTDNANIVTVLSAREINPRLWIASRVV